MGKPENRETDVSGHAGPGKPARRSIQVEVAYARPEVQVVIPVELEEGGTAKEAIERSGVLSRYPEIDLGRNKVGIFGKVSKLDAVLRPRDRVEIYRPLIADPKEVRKQRAAEGKRMKKGGGELDAEGGS